MLAARGGLSLGSPLGQSLTLILRENPDQVECGGERGCSGAVWVFKCVTRR